MVDSVPAFGASTSMPRDQRFGFLFDFSVKASCFATSLSELSSVLLVAEAAMEEGGVCPSSPPVDAPS